jgi:hypothetical protein
MHFDLARWIHYLIVNLLTVDNTAEASALTTMRSIHLQLLICRISFPLRSIGICISNIIYCLVELLGILDLIILVLVNTLSSVDGF